jgi:hypothetical protein
VVKNFKRAKNVETWVQEQGQVLSHAVNNFITRKILSWLGHEEPKSDRGYVKK